MTPTPTYFKTAKLCRQRKELFYARHRYKLLTGIGLVVAGIMVLA